MFSFLEIILLVTAVSLDLFVTSFGYGTNKIKIPISSALIINIICTLALIISLIFGNIISSFISHIITSVACSLILIILGIIKLFDSTIKTFINKNENLNKELEFSIFNLKFILNIYANPENADTDLSKVLSIYEALPLAVALSLDGLAVGFGAGIVSVSILEIALTSMSLGIIAVLSGSIIGNKLASITNLNLSWISRYIINYIGIIQIKHLRILLH